LKPWEFRDWPCPRAVRGQRIVIHAAARKCRPAELAELLNDPDRLKHSIGVTADTGFQKRQGLAMDLLEKEWSARSHGGMLRRGEALCTAIIGEPQRCSQVFAGIMNPADIDPKKWAWPLTEIRLLNPTIAIKGAQGFWNWPRDMEWLVTP
jgi:hypothetical protein